MSDYLAPTRDMQFVIDEIAELESIAALPGYEDATSELVEAVLEQAGKLASEVFAPLNHPGDEHGTRIENGIVISPPGYAEAYRQFVENGWQGIGKSTEIDGQGLPFLVHSAVAEMWYASNMAFALCPLLTSGAIEAIETHATPELRDLYLPQMISGEWEWHHESDRTTGGYRSGCDKDAGATRSRSLSNTGAENLHHLG
jgi:alkylation response protein AidB-like acyl-CoA dehydrogenase